MVDARDARREADDRVGVGHSGRVLEPSPPAVIDGQSEADDPVVRGEVPRGTVVVGPTPSADQSWEEWAGDDPASRSWVDARWLTSGGRAMTAVPDGFVTARDRLHLVASNVLTQARFAANGKIGLRWTLGGFGTPFYRDPETGEDTQVRVGSEGLIVQRGGRATATPLTTLGAAANAAGMGAVDPSWIAALDLHDPPTIGRADDSVEVDPEHITFLGEWYGLSYAVLERLRDDEASIDASRPQIWPEHFDPAIEVLSEPRRASYGFSPGDGSSELPYAYVSVWSPDGVVDDGDPRWNASGYVGAVLPYDQIAGASAPVTLVLKWMRERRDLLAERRTS